MFSYLATHKPKQKSYFSRYNKTTLTAMTIASWKLSTTTNLGKNLEALKKLVNLSRKLASPVISDIFFCILRSFAFKNQSIFITIWKLFA